MSALNYNLDNYSKVDLFEMFDLKIDEDFEKNKLNENYNKILTNVKAEQCIPESEKSLILDFLDKAFKHLLVNDSEYKLTEGTFMPDLEKNEVFSEENPIIKKKINKEFKSLINPLKKVVITKTLCINTLFRKNYYGQNSTDFIIDLPETLKNVTSLTLTNTDIPNTMYTFSSLTGTNEFTIETYEVVASAAASAKKKHIIRIKNGNYTPEDLVDYLNKYVFSPAIDANNKELRRVGCFYDKSNKKISFFRDTRSRDSSGPEGGLRDGYDYDDSTTNNKKYCFNIDWRLNSDVNRSIQLNMGWILGFRKQYYNVDDYTPRQQITHDKYPGFNPECQYKGQSTEYVLLSLNDYAKSKGDTILSPFEESSYADGDILAKLPVVNNKIVYREEMCRVYREYYGPINLKKLKIRLLDEFGRTVDLHNSDYSFSLKLEMIYD